MNFIDKWLINRNNTCRGYYIYTLGNGKKLLCKILCEYEPEDKKEADDDLLKLVTKNITEKELIKKGFRKNF